MDNKPPRYFMLESEDGSVSFYNESVHGYKTLPVSVLVGAEDMTTFPHIVWEERPNEDCKIPAEASLITEEEYAEYVGIVKNG